MAVARATFGGSGEEQRCRLAEDVYAAGGARDARWSEKESSGEMLSGGAACHATCRASGMRSTGAAANAGMCRDWQTWQAMSRPAACWWTNTPPAAKYSSARQPNTASVRLPVSLSRGCIFLPCTPQCSSLDGRSTTSVALYPTQMEDLDLATFLP